MIRSVELFAGAGGLALGLEYAGIEVEMLVEIDRDCASTLKKNRPGWNAVHADVASVDIPCADILTGGFPCQPFSNAGKRLGFEDDRGNAFHLFMEAIRQSQPRVFLMENVRGLVSHDRGETLKYIIYNLENLGYEVQWSILNAVNYGVPQKRERLFIVGTHPGLKFSFPQPRNEVLTMRDALAGVPMSQGITYSDRKKAVMSLVPPGGCWRDLPVEVQKEYMLSCWYMGAERLGWQEGSPGTNHV